MKEYDITALLRLCALIKEAEGAEKWLLDNDYRELVEFWKAFEDNKISFKWLLENKHLELAALINGFQGEDQAKMWLLKNGHPELAALIDASDGNKSAVALLLKLNKKGWLAVAREIYLWNKKNQKKGFWSIFDFGNPYK